MGPLSTPLVVGSDCGGKEPFSRHSLAELAFVSNTGEIGTLLGFLKMEEKAGATSGRCSHRLLVCLTHHRCFSRLLSLECWPAVTPRVLVDRNSKSP